MPIPIPVSLESSSPAGGGLLTVARSLPAGWQRGISFTDNNCLQPVVMGECPSGTNLKPGQRGDIAMFRPVSVVMAVECTVASQYPVEGVGEAELERTRDFALARELLTGEASERDRNPLSLDIDGVTPFPGNPSLQSEASDLGAAFASVAAMVACIEQNLSEATFGRGGVLFAGPGLLTYMFSARTIWRDGARWRTAAGNTVIVSGGFDGRAPADTEGPAASDPLYLYGVADVWASVGERQVYTDVNRQVNTETSRAEDVALAAFSPCAVFAAASTAAVAC